MRQLATIRTIEKISPIEGADRIDVANLKDLAYDCVVKKGEYQVGQKVIYIECDAICPEKPEFEFLREVKFRIKIRRYRKQISEGLIMPISILPPDCEIEEGKEVTDIIGVKNYIRASEEEEEKNLASDKKRSKFMRFLMNFYIFRKIYLCFNSNVKGNWPGHTGIVKSDESRIQTCARLLMEHYNEKWYITEKIDGQSSLFFTHIVKKWGRSIKEFGVCSRNIWLKTSNNSNYWKAAIKFELNKKMPAYNCLLGVQAELIFPNVQANKYRVVDIDILVFSMYKDGVLVGLEEMEKVCAELGIKTVPIINRSFIPSKEIGEGKEVKEVVDYMVKLSQGDSTLLKRKREGIVVRLCSNPKISFKVINPYFLLENEEKAKTIKENKNEQVKS